MNPINAEAIALVLATLERSVPQYMSLSEALQRAFEFGQIKGNIDGLDRGYAIGMRQAEALEAFRQGVAKDIEKITNERKP